MDLPAQLTLDLPASSSVLVAGMGGGFDVFCGLPIAFALRARGHTVHLASLSFAATAEYADGVWLSDTLVGVGAALEGTAGYHPERFLARWFQEAPGESTLIWCMEPAGGRQLRRDFELLAEKLALDAVLLVDGGVDSLTRGDEELCGSVLEDYLSLAAVYGLDAIPCRYMACVGLGIETDVSHRAVLENVARLTADRGFLGVAALLPQSEEFRRYEEAVTAVHRQPGQHPSVINASVLSAAQGRFGDYHATERTRGSELQISPLMSLYWFFQVDAVASRNLFVPQLAGTESMSEAFGVVYDAREHIALRAPEPFRLP
jgi:hypothetical protein